jgi:hypothetical protein
MDRYLILFCGLVVAVKCAQAQEVVQSVTVDATVAMRDSLDGGPRSIPLLRSGEAYSTVRGADLKDDSINVAVKPRLLPENMSFMERGLWGENGVLRGMGIAGPLTVEARKSELSARRTMLTAHQIGGFATLGLMLTTVYFGQQYLDHGLRNDRDLHQTFVTATIISYSATALLSVLSPPPVIRRDEVSTTTIHKTLAWVHVAGMIVTPLLGAAISRRGASFEDRARYHQVSAYITTAVFAASMIIITF